MTPKVALGLRRNSETRSGGEQGRWALTLGSSTSWNPIWEYVTPEGDRYWEDLSGFRQRIIDRIEWFWEEFSDDIDTVLGAS